MSWKVEITTATTDDRHWVSNGLRFATRDEAEDYAVDLAYRWTAVHQTRIAESPDPINADFADRNLKRVAGGVSAEETLLRQIADELLAAAARAYGEPPTVRMTAARLRDYAAMIEGYAKAMERIARPVEHT